MILCDTEIRAALQHDPIRIEPLPGKERINTSSVDLTLGSEFKRWKAFQPGLEGIVDPSAPDFSFARLAANNLESVESERDGSVLMKPRDFLLGITQEKVELPISARLAARVEGRSSLARLGLGVHVTAPTIHAGFRGAITLEITNLGPLTLRLRPGMKVCQLIIEQVFGTPSMDMGGMFQDQSTVTGRTSG